MRIVVLLALVGQSKLFQVHKALPRVRDLRSLSFAIPPIGVIHVALLFLAVVTGVDAVVFARVLFEVLGQDLQRLLLLLCERGFSEGRPVRSQSVAVNEGVPSRFDVEETCLCIVQCFGKCLIRERRLRPG